MVALAAAEARVIHVSYELGEVNQEHLAAYQGLIGRAEHHQISHGGHGSIVKRAPLLPFPLPAIPKKALKYSYCVIGTLGLCAVGK